MHATCGKCKGRHATIDAARACYAGELFACDWLVRRPSGFIFIDGLDEPIDVDEAILPCGAEAWPVQGGWTCAKHHWHIDAQTLQDRGLGFAEDVGEAKALAQAGLVPLTMTGGSWF